MEKRIITIIIVVFLVLFGFWFFNSPGGLALRQSVNNAAVNSQAAVYPAYTGTTYPTYTTSPVYPTYSNYPTTAPVYSNSYPAYNNNNAYYSTSQPYVTFPIAHSTAYSYYSGPTTYYTQQYSTPNYYPTTYPGTFPRTNCYSQPDGSVTCNY